MKTGVVICYKNGSRLFFNTESAFFRYTDFIAENSTKLPYNLFHIAIIYNLRGYYRCPFVK